MMVTVATRIRLIAFAIIGSFVIYYIGTSYADLGRFVGLKDYYTVQVELPEAGGLLTNADVTYRGISVGRVGPVRLNSTGVVAELRIKKKAPQIPASAQALVASRSAVGEQFIDLRPASGEGPYLVAGSTIKQNATKIPPPVTDLIGSLNEFTKSVPVEALRTVVDELGSAFAMQGPDLQSLLDNGSEFIEAANEHVDPTIQLIINGEAVLRTQNEEAESLKSFGRNAKLLAAQLRSSDTDLRKVIGAAPEAAEQFAGLTRDLDPSLSVLFANLLTTSDVFLTRKKGLEELLVKVPAAVAMGSTVTRGGELKMGLVATFFKPLPCTRGYEGTPYRNGLDVSAGAPLNTAASCTMPASSGTGVRGSAHAPKGGPLPPAAKPGSVGIGDPASALPGALGLPSLPDAQADLSWLLGLR